MIINLQTNLCSPFKEFGGRYFKILIQEMRSINNIYILLTSIFLFGCTDEAFVEIDSLNHPGNSFFQGQNVPIWVSVNVSNLKNATYDWECTGGEFQYNPATVKTLSYTVWQAPKVNGEYTISCTVNCDGEKQSRSTKIKVNKFFLVNFEITNDNEYFKAADYPLTNGFLTNVMNGEAELICSKSNTLGQFSMANPIDSAIQKTGFAFKVDMAWRSNFKSANTPIVWRYIFYKPKNIDGTDVKEYIREVQVQLFPKSNALTTSLPNTFGTTLPIGSNYIIGYEVFNPIYSSSSWYTMAFGQNDAFLMHDGALVDATNMGYRNFRLKIAANNVVDFGMDNLYQINSSKLLDWFVAHTAVYQQLQLKNIMFRSYDGCNIYLDNWGLELN